MCNLDCLVWAERHLGPEHVSDKRVIEVGSYNYNGTLRDTVLELNPAEYIGVDLCHGPGVDMLCDVENLVEKFGMDSFDLVISTCMLEHVRGWDRAVSNIKNICKAGGIILLIVPAVWEYHGCPYDFWRFDSKDVQQLFSDCEILTLEQDHGTETLVYALIRKPVLFIENDLSHYVLYSVVTRRTIHSISSHRWYAFRTITAIQQRLHRVRQIFRRVMMSL